MEWTNYIVSDNNILLGKPTIKGTRISVEFLLKLLASGWTMSQILENYPSIKQKHLQAIFSYIQEGIKDNFVYNYQLEAV